MRRVSVWFFLPLMVVAAMAQTDKGPVKVLTSLPGSCAVSQQDTQIRLSDGATEDGKHYCCRGGSYVLCPDADTSAELATEIVDEVGTDKVVFSRQSQLEAVTINVDPTAPTDNVLETNDEDSNPALYVDYLGKVNLGAPPATAARINVKHDTDEVQPVAPDGFPLHEPFIWWIADDITGGVDGVNCVESTPCIMHERGTSTATRFRDGKVVVGPTGFIFKDGAGVDFGGHDAVEQPAIGADMTLSGIDNYIPELVISGAFTFALVYDPNGLGNDEVIALGVGQGQSGDSNVVVPGASPTGRCVFRDDDMTEADMGDKNNNLDRPGVIIMRRSAADALDCFGTSNAAQPVTYGTNTESGTWVANALLERDGTTEAPPGFRIAELVVYKTKLSDGERDQLYQHLAIKYGLDQMDEGTGAAGSGGGPLFHGYDQVDSRVFQVSASGSVGVGLGATEGPAAEVHARGTTGPQARWDYDAFNYCMFTTDANGDGTPDCTGGDITFPDNVTFQGTVSGFPASSCLLTPAEDEFSLGRAIDASGALTCIAPIADGVATAGNLVYVATDGTDSFQTNDRLFFSPPGSLRWNGPAAEDFITVGCIGGAGCQIDMGSEVATAKPLVIDNDYGRISLFPCSEGGCSGGSEQVVVDGNVLKVGDGTNSDTSILFDDAGGTESIHWESTTDTFNFSRAVVLPTGMTIDVDGELAVAADAQAANRDSLTFFDGTAATYLPGVLATEVPADGEALTWNTGGTITWDSVGTPTSGAAGLVQYSDGAGGHDAEAEFSYDETLNRVKVVEGTQVGTTTDTSHEIWRVSLSTVTGPGQGGLPGGNGNFSDPVQRFDAATDMIQTYAAGNPNQATNRVDGYQWLVPGGGHKDSIPGLRMLQITKDNVLFGSAGRTANISFFGNAIITAGSLQTPAGKVEMDIEALTAGTTQTLAGATQINLNIAAVTTNNANDGVKLLGDKAIRWVYNLSTTNQLSLWPPDGTDQINSRPAGEFVTIPPNQMAVCAATEFGANAKFDCSSPRLTGNAAEGQAITARASQTITLDTGALFTNSIGDMLPANSFIRGVVARVTSNITGPGLTDWSLGDASTPNRFSFANTGLTAGTTVVGIRHHDPGSQISRGTATITSGNTFVNVTHNLRQTPTSDRIFLTPTNNPTNDPQHVWVDNITSTQFRINMRNGSGPGASNMTFGWRASNPRATPMQITAAPLRITVRGGNPTGGAIKVTVFYEQYIAPNQ